MRTALSCVFLLAVAIFFLPKLRLQPLGPLITTNTRSGGVAYQVDGASFDGNHHQKGELDCRFVGYDSSPYFEGTFTPSESSFSTSAQRRAVEARCNDLPTDLFKDGFPPRRLAPGVEGPLFFGRIL
jgi:hypothetical protein